MPTTQCCQALPRRQVSQCQRLKDGQRKWAALRHKLCIPMPASASMYMLLPKCPTLLTVKTSAIHPRSGQNSTRPQAHSTQDWAACASTHLLSLSCLRQATPTSPYTASLQMSMTAQSSPGGYFPALKPVSHAVRSSRQGIDHLSNIGPGAAGVFRHRHKDGFASPASVRAVDV